MLAGAGTRPPHGHEDCPRVPKWPPQHSGGGVSLGHTDAPVSTSALPDLRTVPSSRPCPGEAWVSPQMPGAGRAVGGPPCSPRCVHVCVPSTLPHKAAHSRQLPAPLRSSKYCISCGGPGLRALLQLGRRLLADRQKKHGLFEPGTEQQRAECSEKRGFPRNCRGGDGVSPSCFQSRHG